MEVIADQRVIHWFSAGVPSALAARMGLRIYAGKNVVVARIVLDNEHPDNYRFAKEVEEWLQHPIIELRSQEYKDCWDVWRSRRFLAGPHGAPCTTELKKMVRHDFENAGDIQVFGYTNDPKELKRVALFRSQNPEIELAVPLITAKLSRQQCFAAWKRHTKIEIPAMYKLGYHNNNCIGCVKGGIGYWNKIRKDFPVVFDEMASLERELDHHLLDDYFLDELPKELGNHKTEPPASCGFFCNDELIS